MGSPADLYTPVAQGWRRLAPSFPSGWDQASISVWAVWFNWGECEMKPFSGKPRTRLNLHSEAPQRLTLAAGLKGGD